VNKTILIASGNQNKIKEFKNILPDYNFLSLKDLNDFEDIEENGDTFEANSLLKAKHYFNKHKIPTLADDSGLEIEVLGNAPGILSKRYSGKGDHENNLLVLRNLTNKKNRKARFRCALTYVNADGKTITFEGFGYDPIFLIESENKTLAELGQDYKNKHSHRAKVLIKFKEYMEKNESINNE
jgi:XTP/dITP diphosphohydrolase